jgi:hypothetical protein
MDFRSKGSMSRIVSSCLFIAAAWVAPAAAQVTTQPPAHDHTQMGQDHDWRLMQDGVVYGLFNHQGGPRGDDEFVVPNWWMGMLTKQQGRHGFGISLMLSLDPATVGKNGYAELFQVGETFDGAPLVDRQHPHDLFMQIAASWRIGLGDRTMLTFTGGPAGEPTLGPVAFMHRASAAGLPFAPLGHHTFDSTHISFGVVAAALERGTWTLEGSVFNGREPDEDRWDFDTGRLDSVAGRVWYRPSSEWELQASTGRLRDPELLEPGDVQRTTMSAAWLRNRATGFDAFSAGYGVNAAHGERRQGVFAEFTSERGRGSVFGRAEVQQLEADALIGAHDAAQLNDTSSPAVAAVTIGAARRVAAWRGFEGALGAQATAYRVPDELVATHGRRPLSFQVFFRLRLPTGGEGRMWNTRMSRPH